MKRAHRLGLVIFDVYRDGHRRDYFRVLRRVLGGQVAWGRFGQRWPLLLAAKKLVCSTCDDYLVAFFLLAVGRALLGRPTLGLSVRSETIFQREGIAQKLKQLLLRLLKYVPGAELITFMPHWVEPRLARYATDWMYDLQFWDVAWLNPPSGTSAQAMKATLLQAAAGRKIVATIGHQRRVKGVEYFMALYAQPEIRERYLFVCIGPNWDVDKRLVSSFTGGGGLFLDGPLRDDEIIPLYALVDYVWACYRPDYDQSSGIFGRAIQLGRPTIVRAGSYLARMQADLAGTGFAIPYAASAQAALIMATPDVCRAPARHIGPDRAGGMLRRRLALGADGPVYPAAQPQQHGAGRL